MTDQQLADNIESRSPICRLDQMERRSRALLSNPDWRPWRASSMYRMTVTELGPNGKPTGVVFDSTKKPDPQPSVTKRSPLTLSQRERVQRMRDAGIEVIGA